ncbi:MAG: YciI family protein [Pyrinomonadaceae bacterium]
MTNYMLLLHERPADYSQFSAEEIQTVIAEYVAWRRKIEADGRYVDGSKLRDEGGRRLAMTDSGLRVTDGPYAEAAEVIGGIFTIAAKDYDDAVEVAGSCPHLKYGGTIELREIEPTG